MSRDGSFVSTACMPFRPSRYNPSRDRTSAPRRRAPSRAKSSSSSSSKPPSPSSPRPSTCSSRSSTCSAACSRACRCRGFSPTPHWLRGAAAAGRPARALRRHPARLDRLPADAPPDGRHPAPLRGARRGRARADPRARPRRQRARAAGRRSGTTRRRASSGTIRRSRAPDGCAGRASIRCSCWRCGRSSRAAPRRCCSAPTSRRWRHGHCPFCGWEPDFAVITPSAERRLICGRCLAQWASTRSPARSAPTTTAPASRRSRPATDATASTRATSAAGT